MHIDHSKFIDLLCETSGIEKEKVEKQIKELTSEISAAVSENEGYEIEGFGVFSKLGNNVVFIPSDELETEINYKYVGMEPIELPDSQVKDAEEAQAENPIENIMGSADKPEYTDPFAELLAEEEEDDTQDHEITDEIAAAIQEDSKVDESSLADELSGMFEDEGEIVPDEVALEDDIFGVAEEESVEDETVDASEEPLEEPVDEDDIFGELDDIDDDEPEPSDEADAPLVEEETEAPETDDDPFDKLEEEEEEAESDFNVEEELIPDVEETMNEELPSEEMDIESETAASEIEQEVSGVDKWGIDTHKRENDEDVFGGLIGKQEEETEEEYSDGEGIDFSALDDKADEEFDDPFAELEDSVEEEEEDSEEDDFVPVVTNISSDHEEELVEEDPEEDPKKEKKAKKEKQGSSILLYLALIIVIAGGGFYLTAYLGYINIAGITPASYTAATTVDQPVVSPPVVVEDPVQEPVSSPAVQEAPPQQPAVVEEVPSTEPVVNTPPTDNPDTYGLRGALSQGGNDGYTVILYSLSKQDGANRAYEKLKNEGYRALILEIPSDQFGTRYRVGVGQFKDLRSLADAVTANRDLFSGDYFISKIQQ